MATTTTTRPSDETARRCAAARSTYTCNSHWLAVTLRVLRCAARCVAVAWRRGSPYRAGLVLALECSWEPRYRSSCPAAVSFTCCCTARLARVPYTTYHTLHFAREIYVYIYACIEFPSVFLSRRIVLSPLHSDPFSKAILVNLGSKMKRSNFDVSTTYLISRIDLSDFKNYFLK